ncbi:DUF3575 domain-containing protein [Aureibaculum sp. A20]|uniref:DUF3575 domain-containing protein n=1 Tax=Aureibaculum flavum TaxID=2795986 RepID=A0ABS0WMH5_9FLAO|nr:DUF3575 domain-containing protein [Aureibaculum flavum]MBJ2173161.1 DUF3575 domain-containing protein [Aureibaculum flavum]
MKKLITIVLLLASIVTFAQIDDVPVKKHEIKANAFNIIVFKAADFSYEYLIDSESSFGASLLINLQDSDNDDYYDEPYYYEKFAFTPYYRRYFSSKYAWGFFLEAFGMYNVQEDYDNRYYDYSTDMYLNDGSNETSNNMAVGISIGGKFVSGKGFVFEFYGGVGRNIYQSNEDFATELVPRLGASFGYRW